MTGTVRVGLSHFRSPVGQQPVVLCLDARDVVVFLAGMQPLGQVRLEESFGALRPDVHATRTAETMLLFFC